MRPLGILVATVVLGAIPIWAHFGGSWALATFTDLSHARGAALDIESAPDESFLLQPRDGLLVHANHFESVAELAKLRDTGLPTTPDSAYRAERVRGALVRRRGRITVDDLKAAFFDDFATPY